MIIVAWVRPSGDNCYYGTQTSIAGIRRMLENGWDVATGSHPTVTGPSEWFWKRRVYMHGRKWELKLTYRASGFKIQESWYQFDTWAEAMKWAVRPGLPPMFPHHNS